MLILIVENFNGLRTIKILLPLEENTVAKKERCYKGKKIQNLNKLSL